MTPIRFCVLLLCGAVALWALAPPVQAYLDPGTGNALLQGLIGSAAVGLGLVTHYWQRIRERFSKSGRSSEAPSREPTRE